MPRCPSATPNIEPAKTVRAEPEPEPSPGAPSRTSTVQIRAENHKSQVKRPSKWHCRELGLGSEGRRIARRAHRLSSLPGFKAGLISVPSSTQAPRGSQCVDPMESHTTPPSLSRGFAGRGQYLLPSITARKKSV